MKPNRAVIALLDELLGFARTGELQELFAVYKCSDESFDSVFDTDDLGDLLLQVRTEIFRAQTVTEVVEAAGDTQH